MKRFLLKVKHECGKANIIVDTPDFLQAIQIYQDKVRGLFGKDKSTIVPRILKAELLEIHFDEDKK